MKDQRVWYRSSSTGDRGYLVTRDGGAAIRLDRPGECIRKLDSTWIPEPAARPLRAAELAQVVHAADVALCKLLGMHKATPKAWASLTDDDRALWMAVGPPTTNPTRVALYEAIKGAISGLKAL